MVKQRTKSNDLDAVTATKLLFAKDRIKNTVKNRFGLSFGFLKATLFDSFQRFLGIVLSSLKPLRITGSAKLQKNILLTGGINTSFLTEHTFVNRGAL
jgi:hypothetical protein